MFTQVPRRVLLAEGLKVKLSDSYVISEGQENYSVFASLDLIVNGRPWIPTIGRYGRKTSNSSMEVRSAGQADLKFVYNPIIKLDFVLSRTRTKH